MSNNILNRITVSGADDESNPEQLVQLCAHYPYLEWGIRIGSNAGPRMPSLPWIRRLVAAKHTAPHPVHLSLHVCAQSLNDLLETADSRILADLADDIAAFERVQLNFHGNKHSSIASSNLRKNYQTWTTKNWCPEVIFQLDGINNELCSPSNFDFAISGLFDTSGGAGLLSERWAEPLHDIPCGWAGGLGPHNLADQLPLIASKAEQPFWINMETHVRGCSYFDKLSISKVIACCDIVNPLIVESAIPE